MSRGSNSFKTMEFEGGVCKNATSDNIETKDYSNDLNLGFGNLECKELDDNLVVTKISGQELFARRAGKSDTVQSNSMYPAYNADAGKFNQPANAIASVKTPEGLTTPEKNIAGTKRDQDIRRITREDTNINYADKNTARRLDLLEPNSEQKNLREYIANNNKKISVTNPPPNVNQTVKPIVNGRLDGIKDSIKSAAANKQLRAGLGIAGGLGLVAYGVHKLRNSNQPPTIQKSIDELDNTIVEKAGLIRSVISDLGKVVNRDNLSGAANAVKQGASAIKNNAKTIGAVGATGITGGAAIDQAADYVNDNIKQYSVNK